MKSLKHFNRAKVLDRKALKEINGGLLYSCNCQEHAGSWYGNYSSSQQAFAAMDRYCRGAAGCIPVSANQQQVVLSETPITAGTPETMSIIP